MAIGARAFFLAATMVLAGSLAYLSSSNLVAAVYAFQVDRFLGDWRESGSAPDDVAWRVARDSATRACALYAVPYAECLDQKGRVLEWYGFHTENTLVNSERRQALISYRQAVESRPTWPYSWLNLASVKLRMMELDAELTEALHNAHVHGPSRANVLKRLSDLGFRYWGVLDPEQRNVVISAAHDAVRLDIYTSWDVWVRAVQYGRVIDFCSGLSDALISARHICWRSYPISGEQ